MFLFAKQTYNYNLISFQIKLSENTELNAVILLVYKTQLIIVYSECYRRALKISLLF